MTPHILVIEDYAPLRELMREVLEELGGYDVTAVGDGESAQPLLLETRFDLVILDLGLPGKISGADLARAIRASSANAILFVSGHEIGAGELRPGDRSLRKPFRMDVLLLEAQALLQQRQREVRAS